MNVETPFFVAVRHELDGVPVIRVSGEVCLHTAPRLRSVMEEAMGEAGRRNGGAAIVVDLCGVEFMDSTGISVLLGQTRGFREAGGELRLVVGDSPAARILRLTGVDGMLPFYPDSLSAARGTGREA